MKLPNIIFGYKTNELKNNLCYVNKCRIHDERLQLCWMIREFIEKNYKNTSKMEAIDIVNNFHKDYCLFSWIDDIIDFNNIKTNERYFLFRFGQCYKFNNCGCCYETNKNILVLFVRAIIRKLCELKNGK